MSDEDPVSSSTRVSRNRLALAALVVLGLATTVVWVFAFWDMSKSTSALGVLGELPGRSC